MMFLPGWTSGRDSVRAFFLISLLSVVTVYIYAVKSEGHRSKAIVYTVLLLA